MDAVNDATRSIALGSSGSGEYPAGRFSDRGIIVCAGGIQIFTNVYVLLRVLREALCCTLPVQLWHIGPEEISPVMRRLLEELEVEIIDADTVRIVHPTALVDGWQLKPYAILHSRFREVLLLDADQVPVRDPSEVFRWPQYLDTGALFWPDAVDLAAHNPVWSLCGLEPRQRVSLDSGQLVVDKEKHWTALHFTLQLNERAEIFYQLVYGDKDTFLIGWLLAGATHAVVPHRPLIDPRCRIQRDFDGEPLFQHRTNAKWTYAEPQVKIPNFIHEQACLSFLSDLRHAWNGRLFSSPERSLAARAKEALLVDQRMQLVLFGESDFEIEFLRGHQFGTGRGHALQNWYIGDGENGLELVLRDTSRDTYRLVPLADGRWSGRRLIAPFSEALLVAVGEMEPSPGDDELIADLVAASGLTVCWTEEAQADLFAALRLLDRASPGVCDRLRAYCAERTARNPNLRRCLLDIAALLPERTPTAPVVVRSNPELLRRHYTQVGQRR
jgi:Mannosyltransferase putative